MTGFGAADFNNAKIKGSAEVKTVNHRYLDLAFYLPSGFSSYEERIAKLIAKSLKRGRVTISVKITDKPQVSIALNQDAVKRYVNFGKNLSKQFGMNNDLSTADIMRMPGVIEARETLVDAATMWPSISLSVEKALKSVVAMRRREGKAIKADIGGQLLRMKKRIGLIKARVQQLLKAKKKVASSEEYASYQKSNDVNEELSRLNHHIDEAKALLSLRLEAGKKLDFIAQEMQRETNTIGSKVQDRDVSAHVIALKSKVEKIREQANNVE